MTPRLSIIGASIRKLFESIGADGDVYWDQVVAAQHYSLADDPLWSKTVLALHGNQADQYWSNVSLAMHMDEDLYFNETVLLMHMDGADNGTVFTDIKGKSVSRIGDVVTKTAVKKYGTASAYFDGVGDSLSVPPSSDFVFGTGDFTVELWFYPTNNTNVAQDLLWYGNDGNNTNAWFLRFYGNAAGGTADGMLSSAFYEGSNPNNVPLFNTVKINEWNHVAVVRNGLQMYLILNGVKGDVLTTSASFGTPVVSPCLSIGREYGTNYGSSYFKGYIEDIRVTKGIARYTGSIALPARAFADTKWLDEKGKTVTANGTMYHSGTDRKFGASSALFNGTDNYLSVPTSTDFEFGSGNFTVEAWFLTHDNTRNQTIIGHINLQAAPYSGWVLRYDPTILANPGIRIVTFAGNAGNESDQFQYRFVPDNDTWYHIAMQRTGNELTVFINGVVLGTGQFDRALTIAPAGRPLLIGAQDSVTTPNIPMYGELDDIRVTKGVARYPILSTTGDPYWNDVAVSLRMDGANGGTTFTDDKGALVTRSGNVVTNTSSKMFGTSSAYFDGSGDYLMVADSANLDLPNTFTIECWLLFNSLPTAGASSVIAHRWNPAGNKRSYYFELLNSAGTLQLWGGISPDGTSTNTIHCSGNWTPQIGQWNHLAFVYTGSQILLFANGQIVAIQSTTVTTFATDSYLVLGAAWDGTTKFLNGLMDEFRITRAAKYRSTFMPRRAPFPNSLGVEGSKYGQRSFFNNTHAFYEPNLTPLIIDEKGKTPTLCGSVSLSTTTKKFGDASISFNGTTDCVRYAQSVDFGFNTGDFTIEFWLNTSANSAILIDWRTQLAEPFCALGIAAGKFGLWNGANIVPGLSVVNEGTWTHIAVARYRSYLTIYVNGNRDSIYYLPDNLGTTRSFRIGADIASANFYAGFIDDLRVTKSARYIGEFSPSKNAFLDPNNKPWFLDETGKNVVIEGESRAVSNFQKFGSGSAYFDGHNDRVVLPTDSSLNVGAGDFTIEMWAYKTGPTATASSNANSAWILFDARINGLNELLLTAGSSDNLIYLWHNSANVAQSTFAVQNSTWYHIAVTRYSGLVQLFINGTAVASFSYSGNMNFSGLTIGGCYDYINGDLRSWMGYIDDFRITKDVARYVTTFSPPGKAFSNYGAKYFDPYWDKVSLAMHMDGLDNGTVFTDEKGRAVTRNGGVVTKTALKKFGSASAYFDGVDDYLQIAGSSLLPATADWSIECWVYRAVANADHNIYSQGDSGIPGRTFLLIAADGRLNGFVGSTTNMNIFSTTTIPATTWAHVAFTRSGNTFRLFINGALEVTATLDQAIDQTSLNIIGRNQSSVLPRYFNGYIDDVRVTAGVARYTESFKPAQLPFPEKAYNAYPTVSDEYFPNVVLGMHMDGGDNGTVFTDITGKAITRTGAVTKSSVRKYGMASAFFNGSSDYLSLNNSTDFDLGGANGLGDFTVECWVNPASLSSANWNTVIARNAADVAGAWRLIIGDSGGNKIIFQYADSTAAWRSVASTTLPLLNTWNHIAVSRIAGNLYLFLNGTLEGSAASNFNMGSNSQPVAIGRLDKTATWYFSGYIDDLRITKGVGRYLNSFTPSIAFPDAYMLKDGAFANTVLLMHMDGADNGVVFTDVKGKAVTANNVKTVASVKKYGTTSAFFDGVDGNNNRLSLADSDDWHFPEAYTIEMWLNPSSYKPSASWILNQSAMLGDSCPIRIDLDAAGYVKVLGSVDNVTWLFTTDNTSADNVPLNQWTHVAVSDDGKTCRVFINGVLSWSRASWAKTNYAQTLNIGGAYAGGDREFHGYMDDLRITKGVARYLDTFTPPRRHPDN